MGRRSLWISASGCYASPDKVGRIDGATAEEDDVLARFRTAFRAALVVCALAAPGTGHASEPGTPAGSMTGTFFMRDTLVPRSEDLALLRRKPTMYLASFNDGTATVACSMQNGWVVSGKIDAAGREEIDRALVKLQRKLA